ncbi:MAG: hypothetical protein U5N86_07830 [Planctomycetota bacterium]|nr:hypothetical protein [Planctomycetota bacterium]
MKFDEDFEQEYVYYVHEKYDRKKPVPVIVVLHGGVSRPQPIPGESLKRYGGNYVPLFDSGSGHLTPWYRSGGNGKLRGGLTTVRRWFSTP